MNATGKLVTCGICGDQVSKRSTLSLKELGGGDIRACRKHPEVVKLVEDAERDRENAAAWAEAQKKIRHMMLVEQVRFMRTFFSYPVALLTYRMERMGVSRPEREEILAEADARGNWTEEELMGAAFAAVELQRRKSEWDDAKVTL